MYDFGLYGFVVDVEGELVAWSEWFGVLRGSGVVGLFGLNGRVVGFLFFFGLSGLGCGGLLVECVIVCVLFGGYLFGCEFTSG